MEENVSFGQKLRTFRLKKGLSQEKFSELVNVSLKTVQRWETGKRQPNVEAIKRLAEVLGVPEQDLFNESPADGWRLSIRIAQDFREEVINVSKGVPLVATITTTKEGGLITLGGNYSNWTDDTAFKRIISELKKLRNSVIQNGKALGGIKE